MIANASLGAAGAPIGFGGSAVAPIYVKDVKDTLIELTLAPLTTNPLVVIGLTLVAKLSRLPWRQVRDDGTADVAQIAGYTYNAGPDPDDPEQVDKWVYETKGAWSSMDLEQAIASVLYATGITIPAGSYANEAFMEQWEQMLNACRPCSVGDIPDVVPYVVTDDGVMCFPNDFVELVMRAGLDLGIYPQSFNPDVITGNAVQMRYIWGDVDNYYSYLTAEIDKWDADVTMRTNAKRALRLCLDEIPDAFDPETDTVLIKLSRSPSHLFYVEITILSPNTVADVAYTSPEVGAAIWNQGWQSISAGQYINGGLSIMPVDANGGPVSYTRYSCIVDFFTFSDPWQMWGDPTTLHTGDTVTGATTVSPSNWAGVSFINVGTSVPIPAPTDWGTVSDAIFPRTGVIETDYPDWGGLRVSSTDGDEVCDMVGSSVFVQNPLLDGTDTIGLSQTQAQSGEIVDSVGVGSQTAEKELIDTLAKDITATGELTDALTDWLTPGMPASTVPLEFDAGGAADVGMVGLYSPTKAQLQQFTSWLWTDTGVIDALKKLFVSPIDAVISLYKVYAAPVSAGSGAIQCGYITSPVTGVAIVDQYTNVSCGSVHVPRYYNSILDHNPYTKIQLYLPFVGFVDLDTDDVIDGDISVDYGVDVLTGACLARVTVTRDGVSQLLYTYEGNCGVELPVTSGERGRYIAQIAAAGVRGFAVGGAIGAAGGAAVGAIGRKAQINRSGSVTANAGAFGPRQPYLVISRPIPEEANGYNVFYGLTANKTVALSACAGYTRLREVHLDGVTATDAELEELRQLLTTDGVIF